MIRPDFKAMCTITAKNYVSFTRALCNSLLQHHSVLKKISNFEKDGIIQLLKDHLGDDKEVIFILLFGSLVHPIAPGK